MKVLILGITSAVGYRFFKLHNNDFEVFGVCRRWPYNNKNNIFEHSIININHVHKAIIDVKPDIIINCISVGDVDKCEQNKELNDQINDNLIRELVILCNKKSIYCVFFSSSFIYDGINAPYDEQSLANPLNRYGHTKLKMDQYIIKYSKKYLLLRPTTIFGVKEYYQRHNPASFILSNLISNKPIYLVDDVISNLLYLDDLIKILFQLLNKKITGEFNIGGCQEISRYSFGQKIKGLLSDVITEITPCKSTRFSSIATRPLITTLQNKKILSVINYNFTNIDKALSDIIVETLMDTNKCAEFLAK